VSVFLNHANPLQMNWNRWSTATGTTLCANACACRTAKDQKTRSGTHTFAPGSARRHPASAINISISTIANANSTSKSAPQGFSSTLRPANVSVSKTKAVAPTSTGTTSSASASANPRRALLLNTGTLVIARVAARLEPVLRLSISTTNAAAASASLSTAMPLELEDSKCPRRSGLITRTAHASVSTPPTHQIKTTSFGSSIQIFATGGATRPPALKASTSTQCSANAPASTQPAQQAISGALLPANASASTSTLRVQTYSNGTAIHALASHARSRFQGAPAVSSGTPFTADASVRPKTVE
jgi:hypothetical protein